MCCEHTHKHVYLVRICMCTCTICTCMCRTHCRYPHIQILHCKVPYSPVHQGGPWAVPQHCDECGKFLSLATWTDRARERERGREIPWDTQSKGRQEGRQERKEGEEATHKCYDVGRAATNMDELIHKPMNQPINQWIGCVYVPDNFTIHVTRHQMRWHDLGATYQATKTRWHRWTIIGPSFTNEMSQQT